MESADWRQAFKRRLALEHSVLRTLIRWGLTDSAFEITRKLDSYVGEVTEARRPITRSTLFGPQDKTVFGTILRDEYLKTRVLPRRRACQDRLHNAMLSRFDELAEQLAKLYADFVQCHGPAAGEERAA